MATIYCRSTDGSDSDDGSTWALAKATLQAAITAAGNGGTVYVSKNHSEISTTAGVTLTLPTTPANYVTILAVDDTGNPEPPTTLVNKDSASTAVFGVSSGSYDIMIDGFAYIYGVTLSGDTGTTNSELQFASASTIEYGVIMKDCLIDLQASGAAGGRVYHGGSTNSSLQRYIEFIGCDFRFGNASSCFTNVSGSALTISGGSVLSVGTSVALFDESPGADRFTITRVSNFDISALTADDYVLRAGSQNQVDFRARRLKLPVSFSGFVENISGFNLDSLPCATFHSCDTGDGYYAFYEAGYTGEASESTAVYRTATYDGTNEFSVELISSANSSYNYPLRFKLSELKLDLTSSTTLTVHTAHNGGTVLQNDEFWLEVEFPDSTDLALGSLDNSTKVGPLTTPSNLTSSSETWTASGSEDKRQVAVTIGAITGATDAQVTVWACLAKPSTTLYVCPKVEVS